MRKRTGLARLALVTTLGLVAVGATVPVASANHRRHGHHHHHHGSASPVDVVASGLSDPYGLDTQGDGFVVAENAGGKVTHIGADGKPSVLLDGAGGVSGVASGRGTTFAVTGGPNEQGDPPTGQYGASKVLRISRSGHATEIADLGAYELKYNPDGQQQFDADGQPFDALSNPFSMNLSRYGLLVADGGANDVLRVDPWSGKVSTFFVPKNVNLPGCQQANPNVTGCDPVPTGVAVANGSVYVSTPGAEVPGAGRVYQLDPWSGRIRHVWSGLTAPTGVVVGDDGSVYVSEVLYGAPEGDPGPGFDPASIGRITRIDRWGKVTHAAVTMPIGMVFRDGQLYSTAWGVASFLSIPNAGQVVRVNRSAFQ